jgi:hypothetical protein
MLMLALLIAAGEPILQPHEPVRDADCGHADHLEPERAERSQEAYRQALRRALLGPIESPDGGSRRGVLLVVPSFTPEEAVWFDLVGAPTAPATVTAVQMKSSLWGQMMEVLSGGHTKRSYSVSEAAQADALAKLTPSTTRVTAQIRGELAHRLGALWEAMLRDTRPKAETGRCLSIGADGETFHFALGALAGTTWSPEEGTKRAALVDIGARLAAFARASDKSRAALEERLRADVEALLARVTVTRRETR